MAKANSPHLLRGKIGQQIYRVVNGKQQVYAAPATTKHKTHTWKRPGYNRYRRNCEEFAAAAHIGGKIYSLMQTGKPRHPDDIGKIFRPYSHNILTARIKEYADYTTKLRRKAEHPRVQPKSYAREFLVRDAYRALEGLDLSHEGAPVRHVGMTPIGPRHNPDAIKISGLRQAADAIQVHGNAQLEFRIIVLQAIFDEMRYDEGKGKFTVIQAHLPDVAGTRSKHENQIRICDWIPTEIIPAEGITAPIPKWADDGKYITAIAIEWREIRPATGKTLRHDQSAIVRIASVHAPAQAFEHQDEAQIEAWQTKIQQASQATPPAQNWQQDPKAFLQTALQQLKT